MKRNVFLVVISSYLFISGCISMPKKTDYHQIYAITKGEKITKQKFGFKRKYISIQDFREFDRFDRDINALKAKVEEYISSYPDLSEATKSNLRELKVTAGANREGVELLLGKPDRIIAGGRVWLYKINKPMVFTLIFVPIFYTKESYQLHFKDNLLSAIERHYLKHTFEATDADMGLYKKKKLEDFNK